MKASEIAYKPFGMLAGAVFKQAWKMAGHVADTGTVLLARWCATSRPRRKAHRASAVRVSWHHAAFHRADKHAAGAGGEAEGHIATLDPAGSRAVREAEEHLKQWWTRLQPLYLTREGKATEQ